ncbi:MAG: hypothetical protein HFK06_01625 [Clostridia bacterium]|nr:hypothetical protein [Clostridia bacterium]
MNTYRQLKNRQQKELNAFPLSAAFSNKQFEEMMQGWGFTVDETDKIISIGAGCFIRKSDKEAFFNMFERHNKEMQDAIAADATGDGFIYDMFYDELANHEYCITYDLDETLDALNLTAEQVNADKRLLHGLNKAEKSYLKNYD